MIKKKRKKTRSKQKNLRKDTRPTEMRPGGAKFVAPKLSHAEEVAAAKAHCGESFNRSRPNKCSAESSGESAQRRMGSASASASSEAEAEAAEAEAAEAEAAEA
eukprot:SAG11_NODE_28454_length_321_cov_1.148649_1_plen_103_part_10